jgi:hypothetical protein
MRKNTLKGKIATLKTEFFEKGNKFRQIYKNDLGYIYSVNDGDYFEVFRHKLGKPHPRSENTKIMVVRYPNDEAFGTWAWTFLDKESALQKLDSLRNVEFV